MIQTLGLTGRCKTEECDFFKAIPSGGNACLLSHILHDWPDDRCRIILDNCFDALSSGERILVVEIIVPPGNEPSIAKLLDMEMMVMTGGRERTVEEYRDLLEASGFTFSRVIPTKESVSIIEGIRP
jgi:hypothetical protein